MQVIALTEELLETARQSQKSGLTFGTGADVSPSLHHPIGTSQHYMVNFVLIFLHQFSCGGILGLSHEGTIILK